MSSTIGVQNIAHTNGTVAATISSGGVATFSNSIIEPDKIAFRATKTDGNQTISSATETQITFNVADINVGSCFSTATNRFTPTVNGNYYLYGMMQLTGSFGDNSTVWVSLRKNGSGIALSEMKVWESGSYSLTEQVNTIINANGSSDYFDFTVYTSSGSAPPVRNGSSFTQLGGHLI
tara:strand:+ start:360 stop:893 length:534 start_codon:yes stop_codon:yes gene_type:complete